MFSLELMFQPLKRYFDFQGRARRSEYWLFFLFQLVVSILLNLFQSVGGLVAGIMAGIGLLFSFGLLIPNIAVAVRRFHDTGRTGLWYLFPIGVMIITIILVAVFSTTTFVEVGQNMEAVNPEDPTQVYGAMAPLFMWVGLPTWAASIVTFVFHVLDGNKGPNRFGPDPKGGTGEVANTFS